MSKSDNIIKHQNAWTGKDWTTINWDSALNLNMLEQGYDSPKDANKNSNNPVLQDYLLGTIYRLESTGNPDALNPKDKDAGLFQFIPSTIEGYKKQGVSINPYDPESAASGAAHFFRDLSKHYNGDLDKMLAGYNWGMGNVDKAIANATKDGVDWHAKIPAGPKEYIKQARITMAGLASKGGDYKKSAEYAADSNEPDTSASNQYSARQKEKASRNKPASQAGDEEDLEDNNSFISNMMDENPVIGLFLLIIGMMTGIIAPEDANDLFDQFNDKPEDVKSQAQQNLQKNHPEAYAFQQEAFNEFNGERDPLYKTPKGGMKNANFELLERVRKGEIEKSSIYPSNSRSLQCITSEFGERHIHNDAEHARAPSKVHAALDCNASANSDVLSMYDGKVVSTGGVKGAKFIVIANGHYTEDGNTFVPNGILTKYMHVEGMAKVGKRVSAGESIAHVSDQKEGEYKPHLHVEFLDAKSGVNINPKYFFDFKAMGIEYKENKNHEIMLLDTRDRKTQYTEEQFGRLLSSGLKQPATQQEVSHSTSQTQTVYFGDSIANGAGQNDHSGNVLNMAIDGSSLSNKKAKYYDLIKNIPDGARVVLSLGTNEAWRANKAEYKTEVEALLKEIGKKAGEIDIISVNRPSVIKDAKHQSIANNADALNNMFQDIANHNPKVKFVDTSAIAKPEKGDGIHYDNAGYKQIVYAARNATSNQQTPTKANNGVEISSLPENVRDLVSKLDLNKNNFINQKETTGVDDTKALEIIRLLSVNYANDVEPKNLYQKLAAAAAKFHAEQQKPAHAM